jgi:site-specific DNA recombinase
VVVPEEAETVRTIFRRYLDLGSMAALIEDLDRRGIRTKAAVRLDGSVRGGIRFGTGPLAHLLKNRFYIGEVVYRGGVHPGEHEPILNRELFEAVQAKLAANAVARKVRLRGSASILTGRIYDDRGNRMSPTHSNKRGARYRYYVSHALLQNRKEDAGSVTRVPAPEIEQLVLNGIRVHLESTESPRTRKAERHIRLLASFAFVSPSIITARPVLDHRAPEDENIHARAAALVVEFFGIASDAFAAAVPQG